MCSVIMPILKGAWGYTSRVGKVLPDLIMGTKGATTEELAEVMSKLYRMNGGSATGALRGGWTHLERVANGSGLSAWGKIRQGASEAWNVSRDGFLNFGKNYTAASEAAKAAGKNAVWGGIKGGFKAFGKAIPFVNTLVIAAFSLPNIITATKEKGIIQGLKETGKAVGDVAGFSAGMAVGSAIGSAAGPIGTLVGGLIGGLAGSWLAGKVLGKTYTEQKAEKEQIVQDAVQQAQTQVPQDYSQMMPQASQIQEQFAASNPFMQYQMANSPLAGKYADDFMAPKFNAWA